MWPIIAGLFGVLLGWALNQWGLERRENRLEEKKSKSVETLVQAEINQNKWRLTDFWNTVLQGKNIDQVGKRTSTSTLILQNAVNKISKPKFGREILESQLNVLPNAYDENGIKGILSVYDAFERIERCIDRFISYSGDSRRMEKLREELEKEISEMLEE